MDFCDNLRERVVTIGNAKGRAFTGKHGGGRLKVDGEVESVSLDWPAADGNGAGIRGGYWRGDSSEARVSDRSLGVSTYASRNSYYGGRAVRSAPSVVDALEP